MVTFEPDPWYTTPNTPPTKTWPEPWDNFYPTNPGTVIFNSTEDLKEKHVDKVRRGVMITFKDGSWMFMATDDECYQKLKKELDKEQ